MTSMLIRGKLEIAAFLYFSVLLNPEISSRYSLAQTVRNPSTVQVSRVQCLGQEHLLERVMTTYFSIFGLEEFHGQELQWATVNGVTKSQIWLND